MLTAANINIRLIVGDFPGAASTANWVSEDDLSKTGSDKVRHSDLKHFVRAAAAGGDPGA